MNRKRHSLARRRFTLGSIAVLGLMTGTCAPKIPVAIPVHTVQTPAEKKPSSIPTIEAARKNSAAADIEASKAAASVTKLRTGLMDAYAGLQLALTETDRLRKQKSATELELVALYAQLVEHDKLFFDMRHDLTQADAAMQSEKNLRAMVSDDLTKAERLAADKEAEADKLRGQLKHESEVAANATQRAQDNADAAAKEAKRADKLQGEIDFKNKLLLWGYILLGIAVLGNLIQGYLHLRR